MSTPLHKVRVTQTDFEVRECTTIDDFEQCIDLQREVFGFPDLEVSPRRHFIVTRRAGGWVLGAFLDDKLIGFVHQLVGVRDREVYGYSHMLAVRREFQNKGVGARLKWSQRERALAEGRNLIRWTWDPMQARNAHFNLNLLGVEVRKYAVNFYGTDYGVPPAEIANAPGIDSDRLFAEWEVDSERVESLARGDASELNSRPVATIEIPTDWPALIKQDAMIARQEQQRVRAEFQTAFTGGLICSGFERDPAHPKYLFYEM